MVASIGEKRGKIIVFKQKSKINVYLYSGDLIVAKWITVEGWLHVFPNFAHGFQSSLPGHARGV